VKEKDDPQKARKSGRKEELMKPSEESVSGNAEQTVKEMEKDKGKAKELEKGMEYDSADEKLAVHQGDVGAFLPSLLAEVRNLKPGAEDTLKQASAHLSEYRASGDDGPETATGDDRPEVTRPEMTAVRVSGALSRRAVFRRYP
jgi:hypothetical protein